MLRTLTIAAGLAAALAFSAVPASAQWGGGGWGGHGGHGGGHGGWGHGGGHHGGWGHEHRGGWEGEWRCPEGYYYDDEECHPDRD
jgi:Spy/CpxP family protein refolding chaperone